MMNQLIAIFLAVFSLLPSIAFGSTGNGPVGFVNYSDMGCFGVTGGGTGQVVHAKSRSDFEKYVSGAEARVVILDVDITGGGMQDLQDQITIGSNKTIIGAGAGKALNGICLDISHQSNIILRNISLTKGRVDGISMRTCHHVWIDHCDLSNSYDGLLDFTVASNYMTVSWTKLHDHDKVSITNSGTAHYEDYGKERVTFAHCWFANNVQRNPRIGYGLMHIYNCYWTDISSYCIGFHSQAQVLSEYNYFSSSARKAFNNQYANVLPYCGYLTDNGSYLDGSSPKTASDQTYTGISYTPKTYYDYEFDQTAVNDVPNDVKGGVGPQAGLQYEPILNPGNGAIEVPVDMKLTWGAVDGATSAKVYVGRTKEQLTETNVDNLVLEAHTTYYWQVVVTADGSDHSSPVYQFTTADDAVSCPSPADKAETPWYRWPSVETAFCTTMPLSWRQAFDAQSYMVYLSTSESDLDAHPVATTQSLSVVPGTLALGVTYYWRVDAVTAGGEVVKGDVWSFSTPKKYWAVGKNEVENMYLSGIAFIENGVSDFSGRKGTCGDKGPGAVCGLWGSEAGKFAVTTVYRTETTGSNRLAITVNGKVIDEWYTETDKWGVGTHTTRRTLQLEPGDEVRIEFVTGGEARARLDYVTFTATDQDVVDVERPSAQPHSPVSTTGWDCEYVLMSDVLFVDSLGNVGDYGTWQVKDEYCSWISYTHPKNKVVAYKGVGYTNPKDDKYTAMTLGYSPALTTNYTMDFYVRDVALAQFYYTGKSDENGAVKLTWQEVSGDGKGEVVGSGSTLETSGTLSVTLDKTRQYRLTLVATKGVQLLYAAKFYKVVPQPFDYYEPVAAAGLDYQIIWSPDMIFRDTQGLKGNANEFQIRDEFDSWCSYYNPTANHVQGKDASSTAVYKLDPQTDQQLSAMKLVTGTRNTHACYIAGTKNSMTYYLKNTRRIKLYYTGSAGTAKALHLVVKEDGQGDGTVVQGPQAIGKSVNSAAVETELDPAKRFTVTIVADSNGGDMLVYATKLWPGEQSPVRNIPVPAATAVRRYNLSGQRVGDSYRGLVIEGGRIVLNR